jgi:NDP-sugar pyrophosphorylase family protein
VKAVVLVGGEGTRLRPLTYSTPKPLLPIANQTFLERQLSWLAAHGVDDVVLSLGYLPRAFDAHFPHRQFAGITLRYAVEDHPLGTAGAIRFAAGEVEERIVVCNGDVLTTLDLDALLRAHEERGAAATIALTQVDDPSAFGVVPTRDDGEVVAFVEKPVKAPTNWINAGIYVLEPEVLDRIPPRLAVSIERETFPRLLETPGRLYALESDAYWIDIGTPDAYLRAHADVLGGALGGAPVAGASERSRGVWVQGEVDIDPEAEITPPVLLGQGAEVGAGAEVGRSVVGPGARVAARARVVGSVLLAGAVVGEGATLDESVLGAHAELGERVALTDESIVGAGVRVPAGLRVGVRVPAGLRASGARLGEPHEPALASD